MSSSYFAAWSMSLPVTTITGNDRSYTAPAGMSAQEILIYGNRDAVTSDAARLLVVAAGQNDVVTSGSATIAFVAAGSHETLVLTGTDQAVTIDLSHEPTGEANGMVVVSTDNQVTLANVRVNGVCLPVQYCGCTCGVPSLDLVGDANKVRLGSQDVDLDVIGHVNLIVGGSGDASVSFAGNAAAGNVVLGGCGDLDITSTAVATDVIGGSGSIDLWIDGASANVVAGAGCMDAVIHSSGAAIQTGRGVAEIALTGFGGLVATGSGWSRIAYGDGTAGSAGGILYEASLRGYAQFDVRANGATTYGGDVVNMWGTGLEAKGRAALQTDAGGSIAAQFSTLGQGVYESMLPDADVRAALLAANPYALPPELAGQGDASVYTQGGSVGWGCSPTYRVINFTVESGSVYSDDRVMYVTVNGSNNSLHGGTVGQHYWIQSGAFNSIFAGAGNNTYYGDGQKNVLEYVDAPGPVTVDFSRGYAINGYGGRDTICNLFWAEAGSNSTLIGGSHDAILTAFGTHSVLRGGSGADVLTARGDANTLIAGSGNDVLHATGVDNRFVLGQAGAVPQATVIDQDVVGVTGTLGFVAGTQPSALWLARDAAGGLVIDVLGTTRHATVQGWFTEGTQLARIEAGAGWLDNAGANALEAAMERYQASHPGFDPMRAGAALPGELAGAYAGAWHFG